MIYDKIYESMLHLSRCFKEIIVRDSEGEVMAHRIDNVLAKFKDHTRKLSVFPFPLCSRAISAPIMDTMTEVEELSLSWTNIINGKQHGFKIQKDFVKLKSLHFRGRFDDSGIADKIPDSSLEALTIESGLKEWPNKDRFQRFGRRGAYERVIQAAVFQ